MENPLPRSVGYQKRKSVVVVAGVCLGRVAFSNYQATAVLWCGHTRLRRFVELAPGDAQGLGVLADMGGEGGA